VTAAAFGVAGPVYEGRVVATNLPWQVEARALAEALGGAPVTLLNDIEALGFAVESLEPRSLATLNAGQQGPGNRAIVAAGTGLGEGLLVWDGARHRPVATEGGHSDFAPRNALEADLLHFLIADYGHVSWERVLSGPGLFNVYRFLRDSGRGTETNEVSARLRREDPAAVISETALNGGSPLCTQALDLFVSLYGAESGNVALKALAVGGVYLGGGIAPKILPRLQAGGFMAAFRDKGRMAPLLQRIPVHVVLDPDAAMQGAARRAARTILQEAA
jgi:glucokinase